MLRRTLSCFGLLASIGVCSCGSSGGSPANGGADGGGGGAASGSGGATGAGPTYPTTGAPLTAPNLTWTWIPFPDTFCRDGSTSGLSVSLTDASKKVMIFLNGGGACIDATTCGLNPANDSTQRGELKTGLFDRNNAKNPVKDWNFVYIPYCTGDTFGGTNENGNIPGVGPQKFVGRRNIEAYVQRIVPTFREAEQVLLTGVSGGGFGAGVSADLFARAFGPKIPQTMIDDSAPPMSSKYLPSCLQDKWNKLWGFEDSFLKDCGAACPNHQDYAMDFTKFLAKKYSGRASGVIDSNADSIISLFYGLGQSNCTVAFGKAVPPSDYDAGLLDLRAQMKDFPKFYTYFPAGAAHTWLEGQIPIANLNTAGDLYAEAQDGTALIDWVTAIINDKPTTNVGQ